MRWYRFRREPALSSRRRWVVTWPTHWNRPRRGLRRDDPAQPSVDTRLPGDHRSDLRAHEQLPLRADLLLLRIRRHPEVRLAPGLVARAATNRPLPSVP